jgi:hypothetical protein
MKSKLLMLGLVVLALSVASPAFGSACTFGSGVTVASQQGCTLAGGAISFSFAASGSQTTNTLQIAGISDVSVLTGFSFTPSGGATTSGYTVSYTATCLNSAVCGTFNSFNDTANPGGSAQYSFTAGSGGCANVTNVGCFGSLSPVSSGSITNSATFAPVVGVNGVNQNITLDIGYTGVTGGTTPEPTSMLLLGSGLLALGMAARGRRKS